jgi:hypothetical protein
MIIEKYENYEILSCNKKLRRETGIRNFPMRAILLSSLPTSGIVISST